MHPKQTATFEIDRHQLYDRVTNQRQPIYRNMWQDNKPRPIRRVECWTCHKEGHISRECPDRKPITCYACGTQGHIRRECPTVRCRRCDKRGHTEFQCYTELEKQDYRRTNNTMIRNYKGNYCRQNTGGSRTIAALNGSADEDLFIDYRDHEEIDQVDTPNGQALMEGETIGALC